jgi:FlaA1/EpsC-like NDP-sugar epimerase
VDTFMANTHLLRIARWVIDIAVLCAAFLAAYLFRFEFPLAPHHAVEATTMVGPAVIGSMVALALTGGHRHSWRYTSLRDVRDVMLATTATMAVLLALRFWPDTPDMLTIPVGVILAFWVTSTVGLCTARMLRRMQSERSEARRRRGRKTVTTPVLLIGAGRAGVMVAEELRKRPDLGLLARGFVDDDPTKVGRRIAGMDVKGTLADLPRLARDMGVKQVIITIASISRAGMQEVVQACDDADLEARIIPGLFELVGGQVDVTKIRPVSVEDLLGRDPVDLDQDSLHGLLSGKVVLITGAGGSIGAELARQAARFGPARLVLLERAEPALWRIDRDLTAAHPHLEIRASVGDVTDVARMTQVFERHRPSVVIHAAAHKHVPLMEQHPGEAVKNNVGGTKVVADLAAKYDVEHFVLVSTDKAVNPSSVMGATKRLTERYVQHLAARTGQNFVSVRFGNVLGSAGSVVPIFEEQVRNGGPVTVTHPDMVRYFMTIPEAAGLVLQAGALGQPGEILVLDMGDPVRIADLAHNVIRLSGLEPGVDIEVAYTGLRPGEKLFEELHLDDEHAQPTRHRKVWIGQTDDPTWDSVDSDIAQLLHLADHGLPMEVTDLLCRVVPEFGNGDAVHADRREPADASSD